MRQAKQEDRVGIKGAILMAAVVGVLFAANSLAQKSGKDLGSVLVWGGMGVIVLLAGAAMLEDRGNKGVQTAPQKSPPPAIAPEAKSAPITRPGSAPPPAADSVALARALHRRDNPNRPTTPGTPSSFRSPSARPRPR